MHLRGVEDDFTVSFDSFKWNSAVVLPLHCVYLLQMCFVGGSTDEWFASN